MNSQGFFHTSGHGWLEHLAATKPHVYALVCAIIRGAGNCNGLTVKDL